MIYGENIWNYVLHGIIITDIQIKLRVIDPKHVKVFHQLAKLYLTFVQPSENILIKISLYLVGNGWMLFWNSSVNDIWFCVGER